MILLNGILVIFRNPQRECPALTCQQLLSSSSVTTAWICFRFQDLVGVLFCFDVTRFDYLLPLEGNVCSLGWRKQKQVGILTTV